MEPEQPKVDVNKLEALGAAHEAPKQDETPEEDDQAAKEAREKANKKLSDLLK
jgi:hypothetical protein